MKITLKDQKRFWDKVDIGGHNDCWEWQASVSNTYGQFRYQNKIWRSHRFSAVLAGMDVPEDMCVCHECDNRLCQNPNHFFIGTVEENNHDCWAKGRASWQN